MRNSKAGSWFRNLVAGAEIEAVREQCDFWRERCLTAEREAKFASDALTEAIKSGSDALIREIAANRRREDRLTAEIRRLSNGPQLPSRADAATAQPLSESGPEGPAEIEILAVAEQFRAAAADGGRAYTPEEFAQLLDAIRENPADYGL